VSTDVRAYSANGFRSAEVADDRDDHVAALKRFDEPESFFTRKVAAALPAVVSLCHQQSIRRVRTVDLPLAPEMDLGSVLEKGEQRAIDAVEVDCVQWKPVPDTQAFPNQRCCLGVELTRRLRAGAVLEQVIDTGS